MAKVLIAGGSGFVGENLRRLFVSRYHEVFILSTNYKVCYQSLHNLFWCPRENKIELKGHLEFDLIINLAGANIGSKYWTAKRKLELETSRVESTLFLKQLIQENQLKTSFFIQASAIGFYGSNTERWITEESHVGTGFLANLTSKWEEAIKSIYCPLSIIRIGIVFDPKLGAFPKLIQTLKFRFLIVFGNGEQFISWIDIDDLCELIYHVYTHRQVGIYNAVSPKPIRYFNILQKYNQKFGGISIPIKIPSIILRWILGDFSELFLNSQHISNQKIVDTGFRFSTPELNDFFKKYKKIFR